MFSLSSRKHFGFLKSGVPMLDVMDVHSACRTTHTSAFRDLNITQAQHQGAFIISILKERMTRIATSDKALRTKIV